MVTVRDIRRKEPLLQFDSKDYVIDIAWAPNSRYIAVLTVTGALVKWPLEMLFTLSGHPTYNKSYRLGIYDLVGEKVSDIDLGGPYRDGLMGGSGQIVWEAETNEQEPAAPAVINPCKLPASYRFFREFRLHTGRHIPITGSNRGRLYQSGQRW